MRHPVQNDAVPVDGSIRTVLLGVVQPGPDEKVNQIAELVGGSQFRIPDDDGNRRASDVGISCVLLLLLLLLLLLGQVFKDFGDATIANGRRGIQPDQAQRGREGCDVFLGLL